MVDSIEISVDDIVAEGYETRKIVVAHGLTFHDEDSILMFEKAKNEGPFDKYKTLREKYAFPLLKYLEKILNDEKVQKKMENKFEIIEGSTSREGFESVQGVGTFKNKFQKVKYIIIVVHSKDDFKKALETEGIQVIYWGHSRYGRGACFDLVDNYLKTDDTIKLIEDEGDQWEDGTNETDGLFRLGYPFVPVELDDIKHHKYTFNPVLTVEGEPPDEKEHPYSRHPYIRKKKLSKITLPEEVVPYISDPIQQAIQGLTGSTFYGIKLGSSQKQNIILHAGWKNTPKSPYDLWAVNLKCKALCLFSCDTKLHFWDIVRRSGYKGWERPDPPTDKFAYFTTYSADFRTERFWLECLLKYSPKEPENFQSWWESLQYAKKEANKKLMNSGANWQIY